MDAIRYHFAETHLGLALAAEGTGGLACLALLDSLDRRAALADLRERAGARRMIEDADAGRDAIARLEAYARGEMRAFEGIEIEQGGTKFQREVWGALREIAPGRALAYSEFAERLGRASGVRAVASAVAANRVAIAIPCHRVVPKGGGGGQFRWGAPMKSRLLELERRFSRKGDPWERQSSDWRDRGNLPFLAEAPRNLALGVPA